MRSTLAVSVKTTALTLGGEFIGTLIVKCNSLLHYKHEQKERVKRKTLGYARKKGENSRAPKNGKSNQGHVM